MCRQNVDKRIEKTEIAGEGGRREGGREGGRQGREGGREGERERERESISHHGAMQAGMGGVRVWQAGRQGSRQSCPQPMLYGSNVSTLPQCLRFHQGKEFAISGFQQPRRLAGGQDGKGINKYINDKNKK